VQRGSSLHWYGPNGPRHQARLKDAALTRGDRWYTSAVNRTAFLASLTTAASLAIVACSEPVVLGVPGLAAVELEAGRVGLEAALRQPPTEQRLPGRGDLARAAVEHGPACLPPGTSVTFTPPSGSKPAGMTIAASYRHLSGSVTTGSSIAVPMQIRSGVHGSRALAHRASLSQSDGMAPSGP
jgi:hypothetical protein